MLTKSRLVPVYDFKLVLQNLHNHLYGGGPIKTESRLADEVAQLVLCKIADELSPGETCLFYASPEELQGPLGREIVLHRITELQRKVNGQSQYEFHLGSYWIAEVVSALQSYSLLHNSSYVSPLADIYEVFSSGQFKGDRGQFFTPPVVVNLAFELLDPTAEDVVIDPACGSGNFLSKVIRRFSVSTSPYYICDKQKRDQYIRDHVFGRDIEPGLVQIANDYLGMIAGGIPSNVSVGDSFDLSATHYRSLPLGKFTKVFTNPPFGTNIDVTNSRILKMYDLGHQLRDGRPTKQLLKGQHPDRLFLELCVKLVRDGGEVAIVLPRQILSGDEPNAVEIRKWLLRNVTVLAVIDLPPETFQPYTGTITSLLVFRKDTSSRHRPIFLAVCEYVGHDRRGLPIYETDSNGDIIYEESRSPQLRDDTPRIVDAWREFLAAGKLSRESRYGFLVELETVQDIPLYLLNAWAYNPDASEAYKCVMELAEKGRYEAVVPLRDICKSIFIPGRHKRKYVPKSDSSVPFLSTTQIFHIHEIDYKYQPRSFASSQELLVEEGWILVTRSGSTGRVRYVNRELSNYAVSDHCIRIVPDEEQVNSGYLYAFLSSNVGQLLVDQGRYASVVEAISYTRLGEIPVPLPDKDTQRKIGDIVRSAEEVRVEANVLRREAIDLVEQLLT
jgi:type I restriction enzyme M protein